MSTVPKLTYAKIGNKTKNKMEASSELSQSQGGEKSEDLFSHMNQENLNYIKKQLKMKKNRSVHEQSRTNDHEAKEQQQKSQTGVPQRQNLFNTFQPEAHVHNQQRQFQQKARKNSEDNPLTMDLPEDSDQSQEQSHQIIEPTQRPIKKLSISQNNMEDLKQSARKETDNSKMYHSVPYPDELGKKRVTSIEGYFGEAMSINLNQNHNQEAPNFIDSIDDYILDLHQSKNLKPTIIKEGFPQKQEKHGQKATVAPLSLQHQRNEGSKREESRLKLGQMKKSSDTFGGDPKNRFSVHSQEQRSSQLPESFSIQMKIKQQRLNTIQLAQQIQKSRKLLDFKDQIIKGLQLNNQLLKEEVMHMRVSQSIILNNKGSSEAIGLIEPREQFSQKPTRRINNQNLFEYEPYPSMQGSSHARRDSAHHNVNRYINSYRDRDNKLRIDDFGRQNNEAHEHQYIIKNSKIQTPQREKSIQKLKRQYEQFLARDKDRPNFKKATKKYKHELF